jgi:hypothetical protein
MPGCPKAGPEKDEGASGEQAHQDDQLGGNIRPKVGGEETTNDDKPRGDPGAGDPRTRTDGFLAPLLHGRLLSIPVFCLPASSPSPGRLSITERHRESSRSIRMRYSGPTLVWTRSTVPDARSTLPDFGTMRSGAAFQDLSEETAQLRPS